MAVGTPRKLTPCRRWAERNRRHMLNQVQKRLRVQVSLNAIDGACFFCEFQVPLATNNSILGLCSHPVSFLSHPKALGINGNGGHGAIMCRVRSLWVHLHKSNLSLLGCWHWLRLLRDHSLPHDLISSVDPLCCEFRVTVPRAAGWTGGMRQSADRKGQAKCL